MTPTPTIWDDVWLYDVVLDKTGVEWKIIGAKNGWLRMKNRAGQEASMLKPEGPTPVTVMRYNEAEALATIHNTFPGSQIIAIHDERTPT